MYRERAKPLPLTDRIAVRYNFCLFKTIEFTYSDLLFCSILSISAFLLSLQIKKEL